MRQHRPLGTVAKDAVLTLAGPAVIATVAMVAAPMQLPLVAQALLTLAIVTPLGGLTYRLAYESLADATVLVLLIVSVGVHFALLGLGLLFFGAEGFRNPSFWDERFSAGPLTLSGQTLIIFLASAALIVMLWLFFERTLYGKALRATAVNRLGRTADGHLDRAGRAAQLHDGGLHRRALGPADRADHDGVLRLGLPDRPEGLRRRGVRRAVELPAGAGRRDGRRTAGSLRLVLGQLVQGGDRLHLHPAGAPVAFAA